ncbi:MAG: hypothetical protein LW606_08420 [Ilumatobacteraceae bacterium]|jgi:hypothetical protein|nr:hypothetical protein [Ilumatobacteraceae bacterium]
MTNTTQEVAPQVSGSQGIDSIVITDALSVIDKALAEMLRRELVSSDEVADLLLDVRTLLTASAATTAS